MLTKTEFIRRAMEEHRRHRDDARFVIAGLEDYKERFFFEPECRWPSCEMESRSTARWVVNEIIKRIDENPEKEPMGIAERFMLELLELANCAETKYRENTFREASTFAEEIVDYLNALKGDR